MPLNPDYQSKIKELAEIIAIEASQKVSFLLNKNAKIGFLKIAESTVLEGKFITKKDCFVLNSTLNNDELGSVNLLASNELVFCVADLVMGGEGTVEENVQIDETNQSVFEQTAASFMDSVFERLNIFNPDLNLKVQDHKLKKLLKSKSATLDIPPDLKDPVSLNFTIKVPSRIDLVVEIELNASLLNYLIEKLDAVLETFDIQDFEAKIKAEYFGDSKPKEEEEEAVVVEEKEDGGKLVNEERNLGFLKDINLDLIVELGRVQMTMKEVLKLAKGSAIELDRPSDQSVDLFVHNQLVARGEIVAVDDCFGIKVTEVLGRLKI